MEKNVKIQRIIFLVVAALLWFSMNIYMPFLTPYMKSFGIGAALLGFISSLNGISQMILRIPVGVTSDIHKCHKHIMIIGLACQVAGSMINLISSIFCFALSRILAGCAAASWVSFTVYYLTLNKHIKSAASSSLLMAANNTGKVAAGLMGSILYAQMGMKGMLIISSASALLGIILLMKVQISTESRETTITLPHILSVIKNKRLIVCSLLAIGIQFMRAGTTNTFTTTYIESIGATGFQIGLTSVMFNITNIFASLAAGSKLFDKVSTKSFILSGFLASTLACFMMGQTSSVLMVLLMQLVAGIGQGFVLGPAMGSSVQDLPANLKSTAMGLFQSIYALGITFGPIVMGNLIEFFPNYTIPFALMSSAAALCAVCTSLFYKFKD